MRRGLGFACLAVLLMVLPGCPASGEGEEVTFHLPVSVREVGTGTVEDTVVATGSLRAAEAVSLTAETQGIFVAARDGSGRRLAEGDRVEASRVIAEVTGEDVRLAARTETTRQRYESAQRDYDSKRRLFEEGLISELELRPAEDALAEAKLELERSRLTEHRSVLVTPISGVILRLARDEQGLPLADGQLVRQGQVLAQIAATDRLVADVDLVGPDIARVRPGMEARVRHLAWEDRPFAGRVVRLAPSVDPATRSLRAEVEVTNREGLLRPGMFVEVTFVADHRENVVVVPREAVTERRGDKVAFVLDGQRVQERKLTLGYGDDEVVEVRQGVEPGERVVVKGLETLSDETRVRVVTGS
jgi:RND family efflux transporter MFP subunit